MLRLGLPRALPALVTFLASAGCVDSFSGSNVQFDFSATTPVPGGVVFDTVRPPDNTYFTFYAVDHVYELDENGDPVLDADGDPVILQSFLFEVQRFEIRRVIDTASPCFIELEGTRFPGLHVTQVARKLRQELCGELGQDETCFDDPVNDPPSGASENDIIDVITADIRMGNLPDLELAVKSITTFSNYQYPGGIPAADQIDDGTNVDRLAACREAWDDEQASRVGRDEAFYEGSDKVFTLPLNGTLYGMVTGFNPVNDVGLVGGSSMFVDEVLSEADSFTLNWQFKDLDGTEGPDYPADFLADHEPSTTGYTFMTGEPESRVRGVVHVRLISPFDNGVFSEVAIFPNLAGDDLNF